MGGGLVIEHGFDIVMYSATKYLTGHSDALCGLLVTTTAGSDAVTGQAVSISGGETW